MKLQTYKEIESEAIDFYTYLDKNQIYKIDKIKRASYNKIFFIKYDDLIKNLENKAKYLDNYEFIINELKGLKKQNENKR